MTVFVFGNGELPEDSLPLRILPALREKFPKTDFQTVDPNEDWIVPEELIVIDTAIGIDEVTVFNDLNKFAAAPRVSMHDFDAITNLRYLAKLGKIKQIKIIGIPPKLMEPQALDAVTKLLKNLSSD